MSKRTVMVVLAGLALLAVIVFLWINVFPNKQQIRAEQIIFSYMVSKGIYILPGTEKYQMFMRKIIWGEVPELNGISNFIKKEEELDYVSEYASKYSGYEEAYGRYLELYDGRVPPEVEEAVVPTPTP